MMRIGAQNTHTHTREGEWRRLERNDDSENSHPRQRRVAVVLLAALLSWTTAHTQTA